MAVGFRATGTTTSEERTVLPQVSSPFAQDLELAQRASTQDFRAQKQLAQRLIVRVRRAAHAIMGGGSDADDAAQHALIEILRAVDGYSDRTSLEEWADRLTARSVVRFARAVRARSGQPEPVDGGHERPELSARSLEEFLRRLPSAPREALLLREVFGFDVAETAQLIRASRRAVREQLSRAREGLYARTGNKEPGALVFTLPDELERWFALRDREGVASQEQGAGIEEQLQLESDSEVRLMVKELRSLAQFLDSGRFNRLAGRDRKLIDGALAAVKISSRVGGNAAALVESSEHEASDEGGPWVQISAIGACVALVAGAFVALAFHQPGRPQHAAPVIAPVARIAHAPTVEALTVARAAESGARLERSGNKLDGNTSMREGDVIAARSRPGCFVLEPKANVCLGAGSEARIAKLGLETRRVELLRGRAVVSIERVGDGVPFSVSAGALRATSSDAVVGVELDADKVIVRALRGPLQLMLDGEERTLPSATSAIFRMQEHDLALAPQLIEKARRDWDLLAMRSSPPVRPAAAAVRPDQAEQADRAEQQAEQAEQVEPLVDLAKLEPEPEAAPSEPAAPSLTLDARGLLDQARSFSRAHSWREAELAYELLQREYPVHPLSREALVTLGELQLQQLANPQKALATFDRYLASGGGALDLRARYGRILALRKLERVADEQVALAQFLSLYRTTPQARVLLSGASAQEPRAEAGPPY